MYCTLVGVEISSVHGNGGIDGGLGAERLYIVGLIACVGMIR